MSAQGVRYRQGTVLTFDPITLSNTVEAGGTVLADVPMLGAAVAEALAPGAVVGLGLVTIGEGQRWAILGRLVNPHRHGGGSRTTRG